MARTIFNIFFRMMLKQSTDDLGDEDGVYVRCRLHGSILNFLLLQAHTKTLEMLIMDLLFADDPALITHSERALYCFTSCIADTSQLFCLKVSLMKTEVLH